MYKKIVVSIICILMLFSFIILTKNNDIGGTSSYSPDHLEGTDFTTVEQAHFGEKIEFDATTYMGSQNDVKKYYWDFGDGSTAEGAKVQHTYDFKNQYNLEYPLVYSVTLMAFDGYESISTTHLIKLYPSNYTFFLDNGKLSYDLPSAGSDKIGTTNMFDKESKTISYSLEEPVAIPASDWTVKLYLEKPFLQKINKISVSFFDNNSNRITTVEKRIGMLSYGKQKTIDIQGSFDGEIDFKSIELSMYGFSIGENIKIFYGGEKPSQVVFNLS